jgi:two-component system phosphate regulon sensor histidine kinase PhoR
MMYVAIALKRKHHIVAVIRTSIPLTSIDSKLKSIQLKIAGMGLLIAFIAAGVSLFVSRRITKPIEEMRQGAENFAKGNLDHKMLSPDSEEMGSLADAMNHMAAQLDDRIETVIRQKGEIEAVFSSMMEGVIAIDNNRHIININQAAQQMIDCAYEVSKGENINTVINNQELISLIKKVVARAEPVEEDIILYQKSERIIHTLCTPIYNTQKDIMGTLILLNDVTTFKHLENIRRDFAANVSHEIKTPLTAIKGFVETLQQGEVNNPDDVERFLGIIEKHVNRLNYIIDDLMNLSKIRAVQSIFVFTLSELV